MVSAAGGYEQTSAIPPVPAVTPGRRLRSILGGSIGNLIEWYDFYIYVFFATYFAKAFFPANDPAAQLVNTFGIYAIGFLVRPLGGWLLGTYADRKGRRAALSLSVLLMGLGSLSIGLMPTYAGIGASAPVLLLLARLAQGISLGGEYGTSATYLSEIADGRRRGFWASFQYVTLIGGQILGSAVLLVMQQLFTAAQLEAWGWRVPFLIGAVCALYGFYLRRSLAETEEFRRAARAGAPRNLMAELARHPREILLVLGLTMGGTTAFYVYTTYMPAFLVNTVHLSREDATLISFISLFAYAAMQPLFGAISDVVGRRPVLLWFGIGGTLGTVPLLTALADAHSFGTALLLVLAALLIVSGYTAINAVVKAELFPAEIRALGVGLPYAVATSLFGGTAPLIGTWLKSIGHETWFYWYVTALIAGSLIVYATMRDTKVHTRIVDAAPIPSPSS